MFKLAFVATILATLAVATPAARPQEYVCAAQDNSPVCCTSSLVNPTGAFPAFGCEIYHANQGW